MKRKLVFVSTLLAIVCIAVSPMSAFAASSGNTVVSGNVPATISLTTTSTVTLPSLVPGTTVTSSNITVTINTNTNGWSLTAAEGGGLGDGLMATSGGTTINNPLQIKGGDLSAYLPLSSTVTLRNANGTPGNIPFDNISFQQTVPATQAAGDYSITVVFTISGGV